MFVLIWMALLFCAQATLPLRIKHCQHGSFCITLNERVITAEAGLCVVIPCSFTAEAGFTVTSVLWYKCDLVAPQICDASGLHPVFDSNNSRTIEPGFRGRVSLLEPDLTLKNCSIIINDLSKLDSGSYQLRLVGYYKGKTDGFSFISKPTITVTDLNQKPTVLIPPLTEGHQTTLTCTAPGLCSGSVPEITWTWRKTGENKSHITGDVTDFKTENLTAVTQRHSSILTFNPSVEHHGTELTCKVSFTGNIMAEETVTVNNRFLPKILYSSACAVQPGALTCVCISKGFPLPTITWPLLTKHTEYSVNTTVSNQTVTSTITLTVKNYTSSVVECVSSNDNGEVQENLTITPSERSMHQADYLGLSTVIVLTIAVVSLIVNVILIIYFVFLRNSVKKMKPKQEDQTEVDSPVYENYPRP